MFLTVIRKGRLAGQGCDDTVPGIPKKLLNEIKDQLTA